MSEEKEKILLSIENMEDGSRVSLHTNSPDDMYTLCMSLGKLFYDHPTIMFATLAILKHLSEDEKFNGELENATIDLKKFDDILKNK